jgi:hypothetical protein
MFPEEELRQLIAIFPREQLRPCCEKVVFPEEELRHLMQRCWAEEPADRPDLATIKVFTIEQD